jgi:hypothetical protein
MPTLREKLLEILPQVLPTNPEDAIRGTELYNLVKEHLQGKYTENTVRVHFSSLSADATSPIAKVDQGQGYYRRALDAQVGHDAIVEIGRNYPEITVPESKRGAQPEEKFRAIYIRYSQLNDLFPLYVEHTRAAKQPSGVNKWKYPDVVTLAWEVGEVTDEGFRLAPDLLEVKRSLGEQPFRLTSIELKLELSLSNFREYFFQCVSNSKWAHNAQLAVACKVTDETLVAELRRLGTSYDVSIVTYGLDMKDFDGLPEADKILAVEDDEFEAYADQLKITTISTGKPRETLDWEHIRDLRKQSPEFNQLFEWIAYCLEKKKPYGFDDYKRIAEVETRYRK